MQAQGVRIVWAEVPVHVRRAVEDVLGSRVTEAVSQPGGFSPGCAERVVCADGTRAFVKAVSGALNPHTPAMHRREIAVTRVLPPTVPAPVLLGSYDDGDWVALVLSDVEGRHPVTPWQGEELRAVLAACADLANVTTPAPPLPDDGGARELAEELRGWEPLAADPPPDLDHWAAARLDLLCELGRAGGASLAGDTLVHSDLRADNVLLGAHGVVTFVDWPAAFAGADWFDTLAVIMNAVVYGSREGDALVADFLSRVPDDVITGALTGLAGYFLDRARRPAPPGLPTVRAFQAFQGRAVLAWVRSRIDS